MMTNGGGLPLRIVHLYPEQMNIYGDTGNVLTMVRRAQWHGYDPEVVVHHPGASFPDNVDLIVGGGGQDSGQGLVAADLRALGDHIHDLADAGVAMLMVCGLYQLFGQFFETVTGERMDGIGIFDVATYGGPKRLVGNVRSHTQFGEIFGYENHSGLTMLGEGQRPFGEIEMGSGNNGRDRTEGAIYKNVYGTYLHGSVLPKNPRFADALLETAAVRRHGTFTRAPIDDQLAERARSRARQLGV